MTIGEWLRSLGLERYEEAFFENEIDASILPTLTVEDLKDLGVTLVGHRRKLLDAIAALDGPVSRDPAQPAPRSSGATETAPESGAERRQLTLAFVDLAGSTRLSAEFDPEDWRDVIHTYHRTVTQCVDQVGGHIAKYMGDGVLAYFGWPTAQEDAAESAVLAGLATTAAVGRLTTPDGDPLAARVGIATGLVIVGDLIGEGASRESGVVGDTPNLAARLQAYASPGQVIIGEATSRLIGRLFELEDLGPIRLKGLAEPVQAYWVVREGRTEGRFEALRGDSALPFVGRKEEIRLLGDRWRRAASGEGQVVQLIGEPGIGKSRILEELKERTNKEPHVRLRYFCSPHHENSALYPCIQQLMRAAGFEREDSAERKLEKLGTVLSRAVPDSADVLPVIAALLEIPMPGGGELDKLTPQRRKMRIFEALMQQLEGLAERQPVLMLLEDIQWLDPTSFELFDALVNRIGRWPVLLIATSRPEMQARWMGYPHATVLTLNRLGRLDTAEIIRGMVDGRDMPRPMLEHILARTEGVPLFIEELTKVVLESGVHLESPDRFVIEPFAIPMTLQDSLMARLDRLAPIKEVAQMGAVIGREFSFELLAAVSGMPAPQLEGAVAQLLEAELLFERGGLTERTFSFKHALMQDAAYETLLKSKRQLLHARVATAIHERSPETVEQRPEVLAHHCTEAGQVDLAVGYWRQAGQLAMNRSATAEAIASCRAGLRTLMSLPETPERNRQELAIQLAIGSAFVAAHGFAAQSTGEAYERARILCEELGDEAQLYPVLYGLCLYHLYGANLPEARRHAARLIEMAKSSNDHGALFFARRAAGVSDLPSGRFIEARAHLERALELYDPVEHSAPVFVYAFDPRVVCLDYLSRALFPLGYVKTALVRSAEAVEVARQSGHRNSLALPLFFGGTIRQLCGQADEVRMRAVELLALAEEEGFTLWAAGARILTGWVSSADGQHEEGEVLLRRGIEEWQSTGAASMMPYFLALLAEARLRAGAQSESVALLDEALARIERSGERWFEAEVHRMRGGALAAKEANSAAEASHASALRVAESQQAALWRLRATISLAAHRGAASSTNEAVAATAESLDALPERLDIPEIRKAERIVAGIA